MVELLTREVSGLRFSPVRDVLATVIVLVTVFLIPFLAAFFALRPASLPLPDGVRIDLKAGNLPDILFLTYLGLGSPWFGLLAGGTDIYYTLAQTFQAIPKDWLYFSIAVYVGAGLLTGVLSKTHVERAITALVAGILAAAVAAFYVNSYVSSPYLILREQAKAMLVNSAMLTVSLSYISGSVLASVSGILVGELLYRVTEDLARIGPAAPPKELRKMKKGPVVKEEVEKELVEPEKPVVVEKPEKIGIAEEVLEREVPTEELTAEATERPQVIEELTLETPIVREKEVTLPPELSLPPKHEPEVEKPTEKVVAPPVKAPALEKPTEELFQMPLEVQAIGEEAKAEELLGMEEKPAEPELVRKRRSVDELIANMESPLLSWSQKKPTSRGVLAESISCPNCGSRLTWSDELRRYYCAYCNMVP